ncbi:hypothetical protein VZT92_007653 [Zoarces viviparus]|uniref:Uncharacterized protein n=1 Tax=Zoarces viviparus TaxID=48416 RepID=A0AAW1FK67_ZOAVI
MHPSRNDSVPDDTSSRSTPSARVPYWGGFFRHRGIPLMLCRLCATNLITRTHGDSPLWLGNATSRVSFAGHRVFGGGLRKQNLPNSRALETPRVAECNRGDEADSPAVPLRPAKTTATDRDRAGGESQRLEGDCCACKVPTLGAARVCARSPVKRSATL